MSDAKYLYRLTSQVLLLCVLMSAGPTISASQPPFASQVSMGDRQLKLLGSGVLRYGFLVDVYAAALYSDGGADVAEVLADDQAKRLELIYYHAIERDQIVTAAEKVMRNQLGEEAFARLRPALLRWHEALRGVEPGDRYVLEYDGTEIRLILNGKLVARSRDPELATAYFGIWLDEEPISPSLRRQLLRAKTG